MPEGEGTTKMSEVTLATVAGGAAVELFDREFAAVLENVQDPNTNAEDERSVTVKVKMKPREDREAAQVSVEVSSKLASPKPAVSQVYVGHKEGRLVAVGYDPRQSELFDQPERDPDVHPIPHPKEGSNDE